LAAFSARFPPLVVGRRQAVDERFGRCAAAHVAALMGGADCFRSEVVESGLNLLDRLEPGATRK
jgi:hypothetical protein